MRPDWNRVSGQVKTLMNGTVPTSLKIVLGLILLGVTLTATTALKSWSETRREKKYQVTADSTANERMRQFFKEAVAPILKRVDSLSITVQRLSTESGNPAYFRAPSAMPLQTD